jgi:hypothetical protein
MCSAVEQALGTLVRDSGRLSVLADARSEFNLFEAIGAVSNELRHSNFLGFLLDPYGSHGLGSQFLQRFLIRAVAEATRPTPISALELGGLDLSEATVERETDQIDVLIIDPSSRLVVVIENKIEAGETGNQLERYVQSIGARYPDWRKLFLFLTVEGDAPSNARYLELSHRVVAEVIEELLAERRHQLPPDISMALSHYTRMMRRNYMEETELVRLAQDFYARHKLALDYIYDHRPDRQGVIGEMARDLVMASPGFTLVSAAKSFIGFCPTAWQTGRLMVEDDDYRSLLMLGFRFDSTGLNLKVSIRGKDDGIRRKLLEFARSRRDAFAPPGMKLWDTTQIWQKPFLTQEELGNEPIEALKAKVGALWAEFKERDLGRLDAAIQDFLAAN